MADQNDRPSRLFCNEAGLYQSSENLVNHLQHSLKTAISCRGVGVHSGHAVNMVLRPAPAHHGIVFVRTDMIGPLSRTEATIPARWDLVADTRLCTVLRNQHGASIGTVEHVMAALRGCGIDNAIIEIDGPEVPIMDGSADPFVFLIECAGMLAQDGFRRAIRILKSIQVGDEGRYARLDPSDTPEFAFTVDFSQRPALNQHQSFVAGGNRFKDDIARARTFGFLEEVEQLRMAGLARGGSLDNAIVIDGENIINPEGYRYSDELARHKILDAVGDLYLAGAVIEGAYTGFRAGHALNNQLLHAMFAQPDAWTWRPAPEDYFASTTTWREAVPC